MNGRLEHCSGLFLCCLDNMSERTMNPYTKHDSSSTRLVRWIARGVSSASVGAILVFAIGEGFDPQQTSPKEWVLFLFFPFGVAAGMVIGWWRENVGAGITFFSLTMFYLTHFFYRGIFPHGWAFFVFSSPGLLFVLCWYRSRRDHIAPAE